jgi:hypothetical protein
LNGAIEIEIDRRNRKVIVTRGGRKQSRSLSGGTYDTMIMKIIEPALKRLIKQYDTADR